MSCCDLQYAMAAYTCTIYEVWGVTDTMEHAPCNAQHVVCNMENVSYTMTGGLCDMYEIPQTVNYPRWMVYDVCCTLRYEVYNAKYVLQCAITCCSL